jgi:hypothetical protein
MYSTIYANSALSPYKRIQQSLKSVYDITSTALALLASWPE